MYVERGVERDDQRRRGWPRDPSTRATPESLHPVRIEGSEEGKTRLVLDLADPIRICIYLRTYLRRTGEHRRRNVVWRY